MLMNELGFRHGGTLELGIILGLYSVLLLFASSFLPPEISGGFPRYYQPSFLFYLGIVSLLLVWAAIDLWRRDQITMSRLDLLLLAFSFYVFVRFLSTDESHWTQGSSMWWLGILSGYIVLRRLLLFVNVDRVVIMLLIFGLLQIAIGQLQLLDYFTSYNKSFKVTGTFFNPAPYCNFLALLFPFTLSLVLNANKPKRLRKLGWLCLSGILIIVLPCQIRSAWLAIAVTSQFILILHFNCIARFRTFSNRAKFTLIGLVILTTLLSSYGLYQIKPASTQGRFLILKISSQLMEKSPVFGQGFERFAPQYMLAQGQYFQSNKGKEHERLLAGNVNTPYNHFVELGVELGAIGVLLFSTILCFPFSLLCQYRHQYDTLSLRPWLGCFLSLVILSLFSYPLDVLPVFLLILVALCFISIVDTKQYQLRSSYVSKFTAVICVVILIISFIWLHNSRLAITNWKNAQIEYRSSNLIRAAEYFKTGYKYMFYEGRYLQELAKNLQALHEYHASNVVLRWSRKYYIDSFTYSLIGTNHKELDEIDSAVKAYEFAGNITPAYLWPKYLLVHLLFEIGEVEQSKELSVKTLTNKNIKIRSIASDELIDKLEFYANIDVCK